MNIQYLHEFSLCVNPCLFQSTDHSDPELLCCGNPACDPRCHATSTHWEHEKLVAVEFLSGINDLQRYLFRCIKVSFM